MRDMEGNITCQTCGKKITPPTLQKLDFDFCSRECFLEFTKNFAMLESTRITLSKGRHVYCTSCGRMTGKPIVLSPYAVKKLLLSLHPALCCEKCLNDFVFNFGTCATGVLDAKMSPMEAVQWILTRDFKECTIHNHSSDIRYEISRLDIEINDDEPNSVVSFLAKQKNDVTLFVTF